MLELFVMQIGNFNTNLSNFITSLSFKLYDSKVILTGNGPREQLYMPFSHAPAHVRGCEIA